MRIPMFRAAAVCAAALLFTCGAALAADDRGPEVGVIGGVLQPDDDLTGPDEDDIVPALGGRAGYVFSRRAGWFIDALYSQISTVPALDDGEAITGRTGFEFMFRPDSSARFFVSVGGGYSNVDYSNAIQADYRFASLGIGQRYDVGDDNHWRWELRMDNSLDDDEGPFRDSITNYYLLGGYSWGTGGGPVDSDGDGVVDRKDRCPDTPRGATVDERGCPKDSDGDGVWDGLDKCPDTPKGWPVDERGCPIDSDGDGVPDGGDDCPDTPKGATVDDRGCPKDSDGDGVYDGLDKCPDTPKGAKVDASGCPKDSDGDGVYDGLDKCPDTPKGATVDASGCPKDSDGDGVYDGLDKCPGTPKGTEVDRDGCPKKKLFEGESRTLVLEGVNFELNSANLTSDSRKTLDGVAASLAEWPEIRVEVGGHTDSSGAASYNLDLSQRRAQSVVDYLVSKGIAASKLVAKGYGETRPIADEATSGGRAQNRRVELTRLD